MGRRPGGSCEAGLDGVEIVASHGYLPAQFLNPRVNLRTDRYGGSPENRLRFLRETIAAIRDEVGREPVVGLRISIDEITPEGLTPDDVLPALAALDADGLIDYVSVVAGTSATLAGSDHIVPPMTVPNAYTAPLAARAKAVVRVPVIVAGRINQPQEAERVLELGQADACVMTRALICDPLLPSQGGRRSDRRDPGLRRLQPGLHRPLPRGLPDLLHPVPGERPRAPVRAARPGRPRSRRHGGRWRPRRAEGGDRGGSSAVTG